MLVVEYTDSHGKTRWGYICSSAYEAISKLASEKNVGDLRITVYLADGTTGDAVISDIRVVEEFAESNGEVGPVLIPVKAASEERDGGE